MERDDHGDFFSLAAATLAAQRASRHDECQSDEGQESSQHPMLSQIDAMLFSSREDEDSPDLALRLRCRLDVFRTGTVSWGLVDDWRADGSVYKRHGIVFQLEIIITDAIFDAERREARQRHIREAIDLVQLVIALDATALKRTFNRNTGMFKTKRRVHCEDELSAVARGVPWELRVKFFLTVSATGPFQAEFISNTMQKYDEALSDATFAQQRQELLQALVERKRPGLERLAQVTAHSTVQTELKICSYGLDDNLLGAEDFFEHVPAFLADLYRYQTSHKTRRWSRHAPITIQNVVVKLSPIHITSEVVRLAKLLMKSRIPLQVSRLHVDFRLISCTDSDLRKFLQTVTTGSTRLSVGTGARIGPRENIAIDAQRQDRYKTIMTLMACIGEIKSLQKLHIGLLLGMCTTTHNRRAVWRGLFGDVLAVCEPLDRLTFRVGLLGPPQIVLTEYEGTVIEECVAWARRVNPDKRFRVCHLEIEFASADMGALRSLLSAFDDVENLTLACRDDSRQDLTAEDFQAMFQYPSIERISLTRVNIPTMDFFNPSILDPRVPTKPTLRELELFRVRIEEAASLARFIDQLNPSRSTASNCASKLECLEVSTSHRFPIFNAEDFDVIDKTLSSNRTLQHIRLWVPCTNPDFSTQTQVLQKHSQHPVPLPEAAVKSSEIAKARKIAFLSTMVGPESSTARSRLDSILVKKIFAFSAPHVLRTTS